jgi:hypothetical protein
MIRINSLVVLDTKFKSDFDLLQYPAILYDGEAVVFLGEIPNMRGHGIFQSKNHTYIGLKIADFVEVPEEKTKIKLVG